MLAIVLLIIGMIARFVVHIPNFTPVIALALFSGTYLKSRYSVILPVLFMVVTDSVIGFHDTILFTWGGVALIALMGHWLKRHKTASNTVMLSMSSAILFFIVTNFGTWLISGLYPMTLDGLKECFILAVPFFRATLISTLVYSAVLFGTYELAAKNLKSTKFADAL